MTKQFKLSVHTYDEYWDDHPFEAIATIDDKLLERILMMRKMVTDSGVFYVTDMIGSQVEYIDDGYPEGYQVDGELMKVYKDSVVFTAIPKHCGSSMTMECDALPIEQLTS